MEPKRLPECILKVTEMRDLHFRRRDRPEIYPVAGVHPQ
jgi:hypothetical protein